MGKIMINYELELIKDYDFVNFTRHYKNIEVNVYSIKNKNCRDKKVIGHIINNTFIFADTENQLKKLDYILILERQIIPNIRIFNIIKNTKKARALYNGRGTTKILYNIKNDISSDNNYPDLD